MRGFAALLVTVGHLRSVLFVDQSQVLESELLVKVFYLLTSLGHQSVVVFFVLSGYLVGGSVLAAGSKFSFHAYLRARLARLWSVLIPCLGLTWLVDQSLLYCAPDALDGHYAQLWHLGPKIGEYDNSIFTLLGNILFLQTLTVPVFGSNGPLWSLANEFWYYILFPLLYIMTQPLGCKRSGGKILVTAAVVGIIFWMMPTEMLVGFVVWLFGAFVVLAKAQKRLMPFKHSGLLSVALLMVATGLSKWSVLAGAQLWGDVGLGLAVACALLFSREWTLASYATVKRWSQRLSDRSFSLYLSHFPVVMLLGAVFSRDHRRQPDLMSYLGFVLALIGLLLVAHFVWFVFERRTDEVRRWLTSLSTKWAMA
jgi:peptidoglycan/LPS O-acetylase OafA/YrhL